MSEDSLTPFSSHSIANSLGNWWQWLKVHPNLIWVTSVSLFFVWWEFVGRDADPLFMSYPSAIFKAGEELIRNGELPAAFIASMEPFAIGFIISIIAGILIGVLIGQFWLAEFALDPFVNAFYALPRVAFIPLIILWAGLETMGKIVIIISVAIFPVIVNTYSGNQGCSRKFDRNRSSLRRNKISDFFQDRHACFGSLHHGWHTTFCRAGNHRDDCRGILHVHYRTWRRDRFLRKQLRNGKAVRTNHCSWRPWDIAN